MWNDFNAVPKQDLQHYSDRTLAKSLVSMVTFSTTHDPSRTAYLDIFYPSAPRREHGQVRCRDEGRETAGDVNLFERKRILDGGPRLVPCCANVCDVGTTWNQPWGDDHCRSDREARSNGWQPMTCRPYITWPSLVDGRGKHSHQRWGPTRRNRASNSLHYPTKRLCWAVFLWFFLYSFLPEAIKLCYHSQGMNRALGKQPKGLFYNLSYYIDKQLFSSTFPMTQKNVVFFEYQRVFFADSIILRYLSLFFSIKYIFFFIYSTAF